ncbi:MAG: tetratricopeptide repeat protein [Pseudomonadota bacterium]|nr:MAG: tetratricopeptide repeat protein [Pseudomonadota bacterium]
MWLLPVVASASESCNDRFARLNGDHARLIGYTPASQGSERAGLKTLEAALFEALAQCPTMPELFALMGEVQLSLGQPSLAAAYGNKAINFNERSWRGQQLVGSALALMGQPKEGLPYLERAVELEPGNPGLRLNLASALLATKNYERVLEISGELVDSKDTTVAATARNLRGQAYLRQGLLGEAGREFALAEKLGFDPRRRLIDIDALQRRKSADGVASPLP